MLMFVQQSELSAKKKIVVKSVQGLFFNCHIFVKIDEILRKYGKIEGNGLLIKSISIPKRLNIAGDLQNERIV